MKMLALVVTDLVRDRLATFKGVVVIADGSAARMTDAHLDARETGRKLNARFLLRGSAARTGDQILTEVELVDAVSGAQLWSTSFDSPVTDAAALRERIVERVAGTLHVRAEPAVSNATAPASINLDAHQLYIRGQQLMSTQLLDDANTAVELFRRATILDPTFARGYLALAQALTLTGDPANGPVRNCSGK